MKNELAPEISELIEARSRDHPTPMDSRWLTKRAFATECIRFAIKHTEEFGPQTEQMLEAGLRLLDAL
jgi:hypothetical protein